MPVSGGRLVEAVLQLDLDRVPDVGFDQWPGHDPVVGEAANRSAGSKLPVCFARLKPDADACHATDPTPQTPSVLIARRGGAVR